MCSFISMLFTTQTTFEKYFVITVDHFVVYGIHDTMTECISVSWYCSIYMKRGKAIWTMISAGCFCFWNMFATVDAYECFIDFFHSKKCKYLKNVDLTIFFWSSFSFFKFLVFLVLLFIEVIVVFTMFLLFSLTIVKNKWATNKPIVLSDSIL